MIHVDRAPVPPSLDGKQSKGGIETRAAIQAKKDKAKFDYVAYKAPDVVQALRAMFHRKCAYCEFNYAAGGPEDVEHFRPKAAVVVKGKLSKPGYYWLGADWNNLLPSCIDCNRKRTKEFAKAAKGMSGKANLFPLLDEGKRWRSHGSKNREEPLLLNPCDDRPEQHLEFEDDGLVRAALDAAGVPSSRGQASIEVYGLLRADLVEGRAMKQKLVRAAIENALAHLEKAEQIADPQLRQWMDEQGAKELRDARMHLEDNQPYLAATRAIFREYGL